MDINGKKVTYLKIAGIKNSQHFGRIKEMYGKYNTLFAKIVGGSLLAILLSIFFYGYLIMHSLYETWLFLFQRKQFKKNLITLWYTTVPQSNPINNTI